jgi:hypothetical protein
MEITENITPVVQQPAVARWKATAVPRSYILYESDMVSQSSIEGTRTFQQYWAIRT